MEFYCHFSLHHFHFPVLHLFSDLSFLHHDAPPLLPAASMLSLDPDPVLHLVCAFPEAAYIINMLILMLIFSQSPFCSSRCCFLRCFSCWLLSHLSCYSPCAFFVFNMLQKLILFPFQHFLLSVPFLPPSLSLAPPSLQCFLLFCFLFIHLFYFSVFCFHFHFYFFQFFLFHTSSSSIKLRSITSSGSTDVVPLFSSSGQCHESPSQLHQLFCKLLWHRLQTGSKQHLTSKIVWIHQSNISSDSGRGNGNIARYGGSHFQNRNWSGMASMEVCLPLWMASYHSTPLAMELGNEIVQT